MNSRLAVEGGTPVRPTMLPYGRQVIDDDDIAAVTSVLKSDWLTTGPKVADFEQAVAARTNAGHAVAVTNGTAALHAAAFAVGIGPGDEVIVPALTFAASANCIRYQGGTVVFADVRPDTLNLDAAKIEPLITERTRAIIAVDYSGQPADLDELAAICRERNVVLVEDAAHALGATYRGRAVGSLAHLTTFSFHPVKHITTGEGGMVTTNDPALDARLRAFRNHGITTDHRQRSIAGSWFYEMVDLGFNYRLTDIQCALGISQLGKLDRWLERRRAIAARYTTARADLPEVTLLTALPDRSPAWHLYPVRLSLERLTVGRAEIFRALRAENIGINVHYIPVPWHPYYQRLGYTKGQWPVAEDAYERLISLPMFHAMTDGDADDVIAALRKVITRYRK
jgi:UDP-4-amino-4,6-dideoxy-N-acetyl-beta-L-altrosamine transaminase